MLSYTSPWMNNCVGALNQKYFVLFLVYTLLQCCLSLGLIGGRLARCDALREGDAACFPGAQGGMAVSAAVLAGLSAVFASSMLYNQAYAVNTGVGTIDRMKRRANPHAQPIPWTDVFGHGTVWLWLLPTAPAFKSVDKVLGFRRTSQSDAATSPLV
jgi:hypothetical protein